MRTNIVIDDDLMDEAISLTGIHTKRELVNLALKELVQNRKKRTCSNWLDKIPSRKIERGGDKTEEPIRTRGWNYWHH